MTLSSFFMKANEEISLQKEYSHPSEGHGPGVAGDRRCS